MPSASMGEDRPLTTLAAVVTLIVHIIHQGGQKIACDSDKTRTTVAKRQNFARREGSTLHQGHGL